MEKIKRLSAIWVALAAWLWCGAALAQIPSVGVGVPNSVPATPSGSLSFTPPTVLNITDKGAKCDGSTNDATAINAALSSGATLVSFPNTLCRAASTINIPGGVSVIGGVFSPIYSTFGSEIICDAAVTPCVLAGSASSNAALSIRKFTITRTGTSSPTTTLIGLKIQNSSNVVLEDVMSFQHGIGYYFLSTPPFGLSIIATRLFGGAISDAYLVNDTYPEVKISQGRFGTNGANDYAANAFIRFTGGVGSTAGGPNTTYVDNFQFNQGSGGAVAHWLEFVSLAAAGVPAVDATEFNFTNNHIENVSTAGIYSDASWNILNRLTLIGNLFNNPGVALFTLNAGTQP